MKDFPRTQVAGKLLSRLVIGTNWILGYSYRSPSQGNMIKRMNSKKEAIYKILVPFMENGVDTIVGLFDQNPNLIEAIKMAENRIKLLKRLGVTFCLPHHVSCEQLVCKRTKTIDRLPDDYLEMIRENDMIPEVSAHMPELIVYSDLNEYDVQVYI